ncbi:hypothetical protein IFR05_002653 [Cadophora sp. M221]|nr:hypothetical protein IFR05_002653 [Cadophora sp. M221]
MAALCPPPIPEPPSEAGLGKWWFLNTKPNLSVSNLLSVLSSSAEIESADPRNAAGDCRRRTTPSTDLPPPSKRASEGNPQKQAKGDEASDKGSSSSGDDEDGQGAGRGGGGRQGGGPSPRPAIADTWEMNRYWIPHVDINKRVITAEVQYYLGPQSTVRAYTRDGEDGFLITTPGECLTDEQIDNICRKSKEAWEQQAAKRMLKECTSRLKRPLNQPVIVNSGRVVNEGFVTSRSGDRGRHRTRRCRQVSDSGMSRSRLPLS